MGGKRHDETNYEKTKTKEKNFDFFRSTPSLIRFYLKFHRQREFENRNSRFSR